MVHQKTARDWNREVYFSQVLERVHSVPHGALWGAEKEAGPGVHALVRVYGWRVSGFLS